MRALQLASGAAARLGGCCHSSLLLTALSLGVSGRSHSTTMEISADISEDRQRLQRHLDAVDLGAPPRIELTYGGGADADGPSSLAVLDSSFNPPTRAHLHLLSVAAQQLGLERSLLLLAKQNADKPVVGASLVQRLEMMQLIAAAQPPQAVLCGVTAHPLFVDKALALRSLCAPEARVAVLVGFDTWVRIVDPKYYPDDGLEPALRSIFDAVEVVVASRDPSSASAVGALSAGEQEAVVRQLPSELTRERLHFLRNSDDMAPLSSSAIRQALAAEESAEEGAAARPADALPPRVRGMLPDCLHGYVEAQMLYRE